MKLYKLTATASMVGMLSLAGSGIALADTATMTNTGPGSVNLVTVTDNNVVTETNTNTVNVTNNSTQNATSGSASSSFNTNGGNAMSGGASNTNSSTTSVVISNAGLLIGGSGGGVGVIGGGSAGGQGGGQANGQANGQGTGNGLAVGGSGAGSGVGVATLPSVGASSPIDVSALRALYDPTVTTPTVVKDARNLSSLLLAGAALLSFLGAAGSATAVSRRQKRA